MFNELKDQTIRKLEFHLAQKNLENKKLNERMAKIKKSNRILKNYKERFFLQRDRNLEGTSALFDELKDYKIN